MTKGWVSKTDMPDLSGKVALVTGANTGIGYNTVEQLALHGAKVYMGARTESKAIEAIKSLHHNHESLRKGQVVWLPLDLSDPFSVVKGAETFSSKEQRLDIVINNAGSAFDDFQTNAKGFEKTMLVNHLGHFILVNSLMPVLKSAASQEGSDVRVVTVSSSAHKMFVPSKIQFDSVDDLKNSCAATPKQNTSWMSMMKRYGHSKLANILFAAELQRRFDGEGLKAISLSLDPGPVATEGGLGVWPKMLVPILRRFLVTSSQGATTSLFAATAPEVRNSPSEYEGKYLVPYGKVSQPSATARDAELAKNLWTISEEASRQMLSTTL